LQRLAAETLIALEVNECRLAARDASSAEGGD
jgi:hypothetical protein